jgi:hypothetical protein
MEPGPIMNGLDPGTGGDGATEVSSLLALLGREGALPPARAAAIIGALAEQLDAVPPSDPVYANIALDTISVTSAAGRPDTVHVLDWDLGGAVAAEGTTAQARALAAQRALASVATALLTGRQPEAWEPAADLVRARGLPAAASAILDQALATTGEDEGFDSLTEFATGLAQALDPEPPASREPADRPPARPQAAPTASARRAQPGRRRRTIMIALAVLIPALAISLPLALAGSPGLNERAWQGWPGAPVVGTLAAGARGQPSLGDSGDLWVSPDGTRLLTVDDSGNVTELNLRSGATRALPALAGYARAASTTLFGLAASPDLTTLAAADSSDVITEQAATGHQIGDVPLSFGTNVSPLLGTGVPGVAFSPDGTLLAYNDSEGRVYLLNVATQHQVQVLQPSQPPPDDQVSGTDSVAFSPDGGMLAAGTEAGTIYLWDISSGELLATLTDPNSSPGNQWPQVNSLAFGAGGSLLLAGNEYGTVSVWSVTGQCLMGVLSGTPASQYGSAGQIMVSPDGAIVAVGFDDGTIRLWSVATGRRLAVIDDAVNTAVTSPMAFGLNGRVLVSWAGIGVVMEWNLAWS